MGSDEGEKVQLYVYDLSNGLARQLSPMLLNKQIDGIWHTAVVVGGLEYYYGGGVNQSKPGSTPFGQPLQKIDLGYTQIPREIRDEYLRDMRKIYTPQAYSLFHNNCNNFTNDFSNFLTGTGIPAHITGLPQEVLATPLGQMLAPMLSPLEQQLGNIHQQPAGESGPASQTAQGITTHAAASQPTPAASSAQAASQTSAAGLPKLPARPPAASAAADAAARRATAGSVAAAGGQSSTPATESSSANGAVNNGPAIKEAAKEIAREAGLVMADAGVPQSSASGQGARASAPQSGHAKEVLKAVPQTAVYAPSAKDIALKAKIEAEYAKLMAQGGMAPNEAALTAIKNVGTAQASLSS